MPSGLPAHLSGLLEPRAYPHAVGRIELVETHVSWVLLTGEVAYKIKRPVRYEFVDLTDPERRAFFCREELRLNRRFAPEIYVDVCAVRQADGRVRIGGRGRIVEHAVRMRQFPRQEELCRLLADGRVGEGELEAFGRRLAAVHATLPAAAADDPWATPEGLRRILLGNLDECARAGEPLGTRPAIEALRPWLSARLDAAAALMQVRRDRGRVRECHGDLHSGNVVRLGETLVAFDCLEFEPAFRWIDVADEVAFLYADVHARERPVHAHAFLSGYLTESGDFEACRLLDLYAVHRALVRAKVAALRAADAPVAATRDDDRREHERFVAWAERASGPRRPALVLMTGLSGSGKTWLASRLAPRLEAVHLRSDVERKRLAGLAAEARSASGIASGLYSPAKTEEVYAHLARCAADVIAGGRTVIVDATFARRDHRGSFARLGAELGVPVHLVHCHAPQAELRRRIAAREKAGKDASEAGTEVLDWQLVHFEAPDPGEGLATIEARTSDPEVVTDVARWIGAQRPGG